MVLSYIFVQLLQIYFILVIRHPDDCHSSGQNMLVKDNNMWLSIFINAQLLAYHGSIKHSLMHVHGTHKVQCYYFMICDVL